MHMKLTTQTYAFSLVSCARRHRRLAKLCINKSTNVHFTRVQFMPTCTVNVYTQASLIQISQYK